METEEEFDRWEGAWVGPHGGITNTQLASAGLVEDDISTLRLYRFIVSSKPIKTKVTPEDKKALRCRRLWCPTTGKEIVLPQKWLTSRKFPGDWELTRVQGNSS